MKTLLISLSLLFCIQLMADESVWLTAYGYGYGSSEYSGCSDAERDAKWKLENDCRWEANGGYSQLGFVTYGYCHCTGSGYSFRCDTDARAECEIWD